MDAALKELIWHQFGAAIDMLENSILACPEEVWGNRFEPSEFWYLAYHTLFWLDLYLSENPDEFLPQDPFTLEELDPAGLLPGRVYTKEELIKYLYHGRKKCQSVIKSMSDEKSRQHFKFGTLDLSFAELLLYNMRHVQHHAAQLNLILRQKINSAPRWVRQTAKELDG
jgi:hypothetical protein